jgi:hypothetical protein
MKHAVAAAVPMVGFGIMDNSIMILAGDLIDSTLGVRFGLATLAAAACGQVLSDFCGVCFGGVVERLAVRLGLPRSGMSAEQLALPKVKKVTTLAMAIGVVVGCLIGMLNLLWIDLEKSERERQQKRMHALFSAMMEEPHELLGVEQCNVWVVDDKPGYIWSKIQDGKMPSEPRLELLFRRYDTDNSGMINAAELQHALHALGWRVQSEAVSALLKKHDADGNGEIDLSEFRTLIADVITMTEVRIAVVPGSLRDEVLRTGQPLVVRDAYQDPRFDRRSDEYSGQQTHSLLVWPILHAHSKKVLGLVEMINKVDDSPFNDQDEKIVSVLAKHAGLFMSEADLI